MTEGPFAPDELVKVVGEPKYHGNPHPQLKKGHVGRIDAPDPHYQTLNGVLHAGLDGWYVQVGCLESLDHPPEPTEKELAEVMASLTGRATPPALPDPRIEAWEKGHHMCRCYEYFDRMPQCQNPYR